jgi:hypothetical protein
MVSYHVSSVHIGVLTNVVQCFETMNQFVRLDIDPSGLRIQCVDHDDTTVMNYIVPVMLGVIDVRSMVYIRCDQVLQFIQCVHGDIYIDLEADNIWSVRDTTGHSCRWSTGRHKPPPHTTIDSLSGCVVCVPSVDFLLYVQHISICESYVCVSSQGINDLMMKSDGELCSIQIQNQVVVRNDPQHVVKCTFKYIRAILSILQKAELLEMLVIHKTCLYMNVPVSTGSLSIMLKDKTIQ